MREVSDEITDIRAAAWKTPTFLRDAKFIALDGKRPVRANWNSDPSVWLSAEQAEQRLDRGGNVGVVLGPDDLVLDIDPRNFADGVSSWEKLKADLALDFSTYPMIRTGSGGLHVYMRHYHLIQTRMVRYHVEDLDKFVRHDGRGES